MYLASRWLFRDLSRLELTVSLLLIAIFIGTFAYYGLKLMARVERVHVFTTVNNINITFTSFAIKAIIDRNYGDIAKIKNSNPFLLLHSSDEAIFKLGNSQDVKFPRIKTNIYRYGGEFDSERMEDIIEGNWYYDPKKQVLVYFVKNKEFFSTSLAGKKRIVFRNQLDFDDINNDGRYEPQVDIFRMMGLRADNEYSWND